MHNQAPVLENDTHKLLWDFNIQTDNLILARRPDLIIIKKQNKCERPSADTGVKNLQGVYIYIYIYIYNPIEFLDMYIK